MQYLGSTVSQATEYKVSAPNIKKWVSNVFQINWFRKVVRQTFPKDVKNDEPSSFFKFRTKHFLTNFQIRIHTIDATPRMDRFYYFEKRSFRFENDDKKRKTKRSF